MEERHSRPWLLVWLQRSLISRGGRHDAGRREVNKSMLLRGNKDCQHIRHKSTMGVHPYRQSTLHRNNILVHDQVPRGHGTWANQAMDQGRKPYPQRRHDRDQEIWRIIHPWIVNEFLSADSLTPDCLSQNGTRVKLAEA